MRVVFCGQLGYGPEVRAGWLARKYSGPSTAGLEQVCREGRHTFIYPVLVPRPVVMGHLVVGDFLGAFLSVAESYRARMTMLSPELWPALLPLTASAYSTVTASFGSGSPMKSSAFSYRALQPVHRLGVACRTYPHDVQSPPFPCRGVWMFLVSRWTCAWSSRVGIRLRL